MFHHLGALVSRFWLPVIVGWLLLVVALRMAAPRWDDVTHDGDFAYLPDDMPSVAGEELLQEAFPDRRAKSQLVVVLARDDGPLTLVDSHFAAVLAEDLQRHAAPEGEPAADPLADDLLPLVDVWTLNDALIGDMLTSGRAGLIVLHLSTELMAAENIGVVEQVQQIIRARRGDLPEGLRVEITGSAAIGGDMLLAALESIRNTETFAIVLVVLILVAVYRAPLMILVPLSAIFVSVMASMSIVAALTQLDALPGFDWWSFKIFKTTRIFVVVILYGAGTDYCLFLIARYKEELSQGYRGGEAIERALGNVGNALAASALTTIVGLAMMFFSDFGKYSNSGPAIALCLVVALAACVTLAPALLAAVGTWVFWPFRKQVLAGYQRQSRAPSSGDAGNAEAPVGRFWGKLTGLLLARPAAILSVSVLLMTPLAIAGTRPQITYNLLSELPPDRASVRGTRLLAEHFAAGEIGPVTVVAHHPQADFNSAAGKDAIAELTRKLFDLRTGDGSEQRAVADVRSRTSPLGSLPSNIFTLRGLRKLFASGHTLASDAYVSGHRRWRDKVTRLDVTLQSDPFSQEAIDALGRIENLLESEIERPDSPWHGARFEVAGTTAGIRDLAEVTTADRQRIQVLVVIAVFCVLLAILRRPVVCVYMILSVIFSYLVTMGAAQLFFQWAYGATYHGLDWKVPLFLFVILIAVGEDYNIYLATRVFEEQARRGPLAGLRIAVARTGGIITSCGLIMAGTFVSMTTGTLRGIVELGFALSLGVLLDTFVVRTILVPCFLALLCRWQARPEPAQEATADV